VQSSEFHILPHLNVDFSFGMWYAEYVGRALGRSSFFAAGAVKNRQAQAAADKRNDP